MKQRIKRYMRTPCQIGEAGETVTLGALLGGVLSGALLAIAFVTGETMDHAAGWVLFLLTLAIASGAPLLHEMKQKEDER